MREINEDGGASWKHTKRLVAVGLVSKNNKKYSLNKSFSIVPELTSIFAPTPNKLKALEDSK